MAVSEAMVTSSDEAADGDAASAEGASEQTASLASPLVDDTSVDANAVVPPAPVIIESSPPATDAFGAAAAQRDAQENDAAAQVGALATPAPKESVPAAMPGAVAPVSSGEQEAPLSPLDLVGDGSSEDVETSAPAPDEAATFEVSGAAEKPKALSSSSGQVLDLATLSPTRGELRRSAAQEATPPNPNGVASHETPLEGAPPQGNSTTEAAATATAPRADAPARPADAGAQPPAQNGQTQNSNLASAEPERSQAPAPALPQEQRLTPAVASADAVAHLAASIVRKMEGRSTRFDIELHPAELGAVQVRLEIARDGQVQAQLAFDNPMAAADFRARADELRRMLEQSGFQLGQDALSFEQREQGSSFAERQDGRPERPAFGTRAFRDGAGLIDAETPMLRPMRAVASGVDIRI